jgi:hypothetical protein
MNSNFNF